MATFVKMLQSWMGSLGVRDAPEESAIYEKLISLANEKGPTRELDIDVTLWGERHDPEAAGAVLNVTPNNIHLGDVSLAMLKGVVKNLRKMMPTEVFKNLKVSIIISEFCGIAILWYKSDCVIKTLLDKDKVRGCL